MVSNRHHATVARAALLAGATLLLVVVAAGGCVGGGRATSGRDTQQGLVVAKLDTLAADVAVVKGDVALVKQTQQVSAGRDSNVNDKWTLRLLGVAVMLLGLSYPVGKIVWILGGKLRRTNGSSAPA